MKKISFFTIVILMFLFGSGCNYETKEAIEQRQKQEHVEKEAAVNAMFQKQVDEAKANYKKLLPKFNIDSPNIYRHKTYSKSIQGNGSTIRACISDGTLEAFSVYVGNSRKNINDFQLVTTKIGEGRIRIIAGKAVYKTIDGKIVESLELDSYDTKWILDHIATAFLTDKWVSVVLASKGRVCHEYDLPAKYQEAIHDSLLMFDTLKKLKAANIHPLTL